MKNQENEAIENVAVETNEQPVEETGKLKVKRPKQFVQQNIEDNVIKVDLRQNKEEDAVQMQAMILSSSHTTREVAKKWLKKYGAPNKMKNNPFLKK